MAHHWHSLQVFLLLFSHALLSERRITAAVRDYSAQVDEECIRLQEPDSTSTLLQDMSSGDKGARRERLESNSSRIIVGDAALVEVSRGAAIQGSERSENINSSGITIAIANAMRPVLAALGWEDEAKKIKSERPYTTIGIFDSGVGGLTVYKELRRKNPYVNVIYFADMARQPYGTKPQIDVAGFSEDILKLLMSEGAELAMIACNTATAAVFDYLVNERPVFKDLPIFGVIPYGAMAAMDASKKSIHVVATQGTCASRAYERALEGLRCDRSVQCVGAPEFVRAVENNAIMQQETLEVAERYLEPCTSLDVDTVVYGCTHFPELEPAFKEVLFGESHFDLEPGSIQLINPAEYFVRYTNPYMVQGGEKGSTRFLVNKNPEEFARRALNFLHSSIEVEQVDLGQKLEEFELQIDKSSTLPDGFAEELDSLRGSSQTLHEESAEEAQASAAPTSAGQTTPIPTAAALVFPTGPTPTSGSAPEKG